MKKIIITFLILLFAFMVPSYYTTAEGITPDRPTDSTTNPTTVSLPNPLGPNKTDIPQFLGQIINYALGIIGSLALVMFIYGGLTWMLSAGNQEQVAKGKQIVIWAALGIAIIFTSYALVRFVITAIGTANNPYSPTPVLDTGAPED
jgi:hypothetical protein